MLPVNAVPHIRSGSCPKQVERGKQQERSGYWLSHIHPENDHENKGGIGAALKQVMC